jgi:hypothetical protein
MSLVSVVLDVCADIGVGGAPLPTSVFSSISTNRTMVELLALANEMAQRIAYDTKDWQALTKLNVFTGDGVTTAFNLPADYKRMLKTAEVWRSTSAMHPMHYVSDYNEWIQRRALNTYGTPWGEWTIIGNQMLIYPAMGAGVTATFAYLDKNCITLAAGGNGDRWIADNDAFRLNERVFKLGMIWQWKSNKGSPYQEDLGSYNDALDAIREKPRPTFIGSKPISSNATVAYPWRVPTS